MMVQRKNTGWEGLRDSPELFFTKILNIMLTSAQLDTLKAVSHGDNLRVGLVCDLDTKPIIDEARFAVGVALWRAATWHRPTIIWTGRRRVAGAWIGLMLDVLTKASPEFRTDFLARRPADTSLPWGVLMPTGCWALRYAGAFTEDAIQTANALGNRADVLLGDFDWVDELAVKAALEYANEFDALVTLVIPKDGARW